MTFVPDYRNFDELDFAAVGDVTNLPSKSRLYLATKRVFDLAFTTLLLLPATVVIALVLIILNPFYNPGPLLYPQKRMGHECRPFRTWKFRTMQPIRRGTRGPDDPIETHRITPLGHLLRRSRFDELPQIFNVYRGDMSLIGPRPDYFRHAHHYMRAIPAYHARHTVRPGISGLAQIELGYAESVDDTRLKTMADIDYIRRASISFDLWIFWRTVVTVFTMRGS